MAYSYDQLVKAYTAVHNGIAPDAAAQANFQIVAALSANGQLTDAQILTNIVNSADNSTALAVLSYQFFTGKSPTQAGLAYLVNSAANDSDLNDAYYSGFNLENRYINFAANLGVQGEGAANFASKYGSLSFADFVASVYQTIVGGSYAQAAGIDPTKAIADIVARKDAILATATSAGMIKPNMTAAQIDLALKAATAGYLLGEAIKADVGLYAAAADNFMVALAQGNATYNTDITQTYQPTVTSFAHGTGKALDNAPATLPSTTTSGPTGPTSPGGSTAMAFVLTGGLDTFTGGAGDDTFTATNTTLTAIDTLNGGAGADTLTITATGAYILPAATVSAIETVNINGDNNVTANASAFTGVTKLNVTSAGATNVTAAATADVSVTASAVAAQNVLVQGGKAVSASVTGATTGGVTIGNATQPVGPVVVNVSAANAGSATGALTVYGGTTVSITATNANAANTTQTTGTIAVQGGANTTSVTVNAPQTVAQSGGTPGVNAGTVGVTDNSGVTSTTKGTITSVTASGARDVSITDNALSTLNLTHVTNSVAIDNRSALTGGNLTTTLNLTVDDAIVVQTTDQGVYTTLNITSGAGASSLGNVNMSALTAVTITGTGAVSGVFTGASLASVNASANTGGNTITINAAGANYTGSTGADTVTIAGGGNHAVNVGSGTDRVNVTGVDAASNANFTSITGFNAGDKLAITAHGGAAAATALGAEITGQASLAAYLDAATAGDGSVTSVMNWFRFAGDTYVVLDSSLGNGFAPGVDVVVKLVGTAGTAFNLNGSSAAAGVLTLA